VRVLTGRLGRAVGRWRAGLVFVLALFASSPVAAHNLPYALADVRFPQADRIRIEVRCHLAPLIMGEPQAGLGPEATRRFVSLSDAEIRDRAAMAARSFLSAFSLRADRRLLDDVQVSFPSPEELRADAQASQFSPRPSPPLVLTATLPAGARSVDLALPPNLGSAVVQIRYADGRTFSEPLSDGARSRAISPTGMDPLREGIVTAGRFVILGFQHIVPKGFDHILFIMALAVGAPRLGQLIKLATAFTLAHSITLGLAAFGVVRAPSDIVEPAIALSIAVVAILSIFRPQGSVGLDRLGLVFAFGLLHGLGFASALQETGLPRGQEVIALASFNVGVELGQVTVILAVLAAVGWCSRKWFYASRISLPVNTAVALTGLFWTVQRVGLALGLTAFR